MLTDPLLIEHVAERRLYEYEPLKGTNVRRQRSLLLTINARDELYKDPWKRRPGELGETRERFLSQHALLARFVGGAALRATHDVKVLRPTTPTFEDLVEFRSGGPSPQSRLFTFVFSPGVWVGACLHFRDNLGDLGDPRWEAAAHQTRAEWEAVFGDRAPHRAHYPCDTRSRLRALTDV